MNFRTETCHWLPPVAPPPAHSSPNDVLVAPQRSGPISQWSAMPQVWLASPLGHCPAQCMRHFSYPPGRPCWRCFPALTWSTCRHGRYPDPGVSVAVLRDDGTLAAADNGGQDAALGFACCPLLTFAQQPSAPCTRPGPSSQARRARIFVLTSSLPSHPA
jgi:hypothetical protein